MKKQQFIEIKGAKTHNLKSVDVKIPHNKFTVITGLSGSGKSSLAFSTLFAEGQRRYIESLSSYARQFLGKLDKPEVDYIKGISPAIAIQQKVISNSPRSTVGTTTEIYDYLKVLYAKAGRTYSPISGKEVKKNTVADVVDFLKKLPAKEKCLVLSPLPNLKKYGIEKQLEILKQQGYTRLFYQESFISIEDGFTFKETDFASIWLVVDRISVDFSDEDNISRYGDSIQLAYTEGGGECSIYSLSDKKWTAFSTKFEMDGMTFQVPNEHFFTFNNPFGACKVCDGFGLVIDVDPNLVIPNKALSVFQGAVLPWKGEKMQRYLNDFIEQSSAVNFPIHRPIIELSDEELKILWDGNKSINGIRDFFQFVESKSYKIQYRVMLSRYRGKTDCPSCHGTRLREDASFVKVGGKSIHEIVLLPIDEALEFFKSVKGTNYDAQILKRILPEITNRLDFLCKVGLGYLTLNRGSNTLSGGESQRIHLATSLGSSLVGSMYILDEPSIGLHSKDTEQLISVLKSLRDIGNTVIVVEHEEDVMNASDEIIDLGPEAGIYGGEIVFQGNHEELLESDSLTAKYLTGKKSIPVPTKRRKSKNKLSITGAYQNNLKNIDVDFPLHTLTCITGVSGSGKSTLVKDILIPAVNKSLEIYANKQGSYADFKGDMSHVKALEFIDQNPIGKSSRSNPVTYVKAFDDIRDLFSKQGLAKTRGYKPGFFSFNVDGGRCETCEGEGVTTVSMQFMADIHLVCEQCKGTRYKEEALEVKYREKSIADLLLMDIQEAHSFFSEDQDRGAQKIVAKLAPLIKVGLGYLKMGQASSTLSGGEAQRIKLASFLSKGANADPTLFVFDEPTTGLHFHDVSKLIIALNELIDQGHSVIVIEHNLDVIKCADHVIELGPGGGKNGGELVFTGTPEEMTQSKCATGNYLKEKLL